MNGLGRIQRLKIRKSATDVDAVLRYVARTAFRDVAFYRRTWEAAGVSLDDFRGTEDLVRLPVTTKADLVSRGLSDRLNSRTRSGHTASRVTSGTSGQDLVVHMSRAELGFRQFNVVSRMWQDAGHALPMTIVQAGAWIPPVNRCEIRTRRTIFGKVVHISRKLPTQTQIDALVKSKPTVLTGCPSNLEILASEMARVGNDRVRPAIVATRGEVLRPAVRRLLGDVFACRVTDYYSTEEIGLMAWQCQDAPEIMHVNRSTCVIEVLDNAGNPVPFGEEGTIAVTNLFNTTMPLIRYVLGDQSSLLSDVPAHCTCGHKGQTIVIPAGRMDDFIVLPDKQRISPRTVDDFVYLACAADGLENRFTRTMRDFQIVQESPTQIDFRFLTDGPVPDIVGDVLAMHLRELHPDLECIAASVSELEVMDSGKRKRVISRVPYESSP
jgi:phenylacetate-coenzyme A ligase PaaK-like adenylate-forming protein